MKIDITAWQHPRQKRLGIIWVKIDGKIVEQVVIRGIVEAREIAKLWNRIFNEKVH